jgi:ABC-type spermidine/putrescine transport systems, ATPase components
VAFGLEMRRIPQLDIVRRVDAALDLVRLSEHGDKYPGQLSGGEQQRVAFARAVVMEPPVVLMDEPLSNLDAKLRHEMRGEIRRLHQELGLTTVYVTHDQEEALSLADRLVVLSEGSVQQIGTPEEVYTRPVNSFVADFMGYRNRLHMTVGRRAGVKGSVRLTGRGIVLNALADVASGPVLVVARPDDLVIGEIDGNRIEAVVESIEYQGRDFEITVLTNEDVRLFLRTPDHLQVGQRVVIGVGLERLMVYPPETGRQPTRGSREQLRQQVTVG